MPDRTNDDFDEAMHAIGIWIKAIHTLPGFHDWKVGNFTVAMSYGDIGPSPHESLPTTFVFPPDIEKQHVAITAFFGLGTTWQAMADTQFYFRRYPFQHMPVSMATHLRYTCETYFSRVYEFSERLKDCLNKLNDVIVNKVDAGLIIRRFKNEFRNEITARNSIHHRTNFDDLTIQAVMLREMMAADKGSGGRGWDAEQRRTYRKASKEWADRVMQRSARAKVFLDEVSRIVAKQCTFLTVPLTLDPP